VAIVAAAFAVAGGAGEQDARTSFVLEPEVRFVAEFNGASVSSRARPPGAPIPIRASVSPPFAWPVEGPITSYNDANHPLGIDIGLSTERSREIKAAAAGTVKFSGGSTSESYGLYIVIDHGDGVETLYGHLSQRIALTGARVEQGQLIGIGGSTGKSDGMHLHFEITSEGSTYDPLDFLPEDRAPQEVLDFDCRADTLTIDAGSRVTFDLAGALEGGESIIGIAIRDASGRPASPSTLDAAAIGPAALDLWSSIAFEGPVKDDSYVLSIATAAVGQVPQTIECALIVHTPRIYGTYFVRTAASNTRSQAVPAASSTLAAPATQVNETLASVEEPFVLPTNTPYPEFLTPTPVPPTAVPPTTTRSPQTTPAASPPPSPTATNTPAP
jgi:hypothetical protein